MLYVLATIFTITIYLIHYQGFTDKFVNGCGHDTDIIYVRDLTFVNFVYMRGGMCVRDEAVWCVLIVCLGPRDSVIGCVLHVNARGSLGVYIWRRSARQETNPPNHLVMKWTLIKHTHTRQESVCMERLEFVGAVRVGVESESCWEWLESVWSWELLESSCWDRGDIGVEWAREEGRR